MRGTGLVELGGDSQMALAMGRPSFFLVKKADNKSSEKTTGAEKRKNAKIEIKAKKLRRIGKGKGKKQEESDK